MKFLGVLQRREKSGLNVKFAFFGYMKTVPTMISVFCVNKFSTLTF